MVHVHRTDLNQSVMPQSALTAPHRSAAAASNMDPYLVTMMLVCTTLGYSLPFGMDSDQHSSCSESVSEALSRGSSAILEVRDTRALVT